MASSKNDISENSDNKSNGDKDNNDSHGGENSSGGGGTTSDNNNQLRAKLFLSQMPIVIFVKRVNFVQSANLHSFSRVVFFLSSDEQNFSR